MKLSQYFLPTLRETPSEAEVISHKLMLRSGMIKKVAAGIFTYLPLGLRVLQKIETIIRDELNRAGAHELLMPMLQPAELWQESGRWNLMGKELARLKDRHEREFCLGPTHEEVITDIARQFIQSYKQLPVTLYQIQTKFRDEIRPRFGLMRGREFLMKDAYSFHETSKDAEREYQNMFQTYHRIFKRCGLDFRPVEAETGNIGGSLSHEFHVLAQSGEDEILSCDQCKYSGNINFLKKKEGDPCTQCKVGKVGAFKSYRGIEVGHIFYLGAKYSQAMKASYLDAKGNARPFEMGCYGIGVGRTMAAAMEQNHDEYGMKWPITLAPFEIAIVPLDMTDLETQKVSNALYKDIMNRTDQVLFYDKDERAGVKFKDIDLIGVPIRLTIGSRGLSQGKIGLKLRDEKEERLVNIQDAVSETVRIRDELIKKINTGA